MSVRDPKPGKLREARVEVAKRGERITELTKAHLRLQHLNEISTLLTRFQGVERTVPEVLAVVGETLLIRSALFRLEASGGPRTIAWRARGERASRQPAHAETAYGYLVRSGVDPPANDQRPESKADLETSFITLPLVVDRGSIFGALQIEGTGSLEELDLVFVNAVANQLAIAVDRDAIIGEELARRAAVAIDNARLYEQAQRATRARDDLLAIVSHDLRNLLSMILMSLAMPRAPEEDGRDRSEKQLARIQRSADRMNRLIEDLLDTASLEAGHLAIDPQRHAVAPLVSEALDAAHPRAASGSLHLESEIAAELPAISVDGPRLQQILANLLSNAIKFTPAGGTIAVRAEPTGGTVTFSVTDTGSGMSEEELHHVFDRFWQAKRTARLGTGLGLFIVKGIVEAHGGAIWIESHVGEGSTFFFTLPVAPPEVAREPQEQRVPLR